MKLLIPLLFAAALFAQNSQTITVDKGLTVFAHGGAFVSVPTGGIFGFGVAKSINQADVFVDLSMANRGTATQALAGMTRALPVEVKFSAAGHRFDLKPYAIVAWGTDLRQVFSKAGASTTQRFLQQYGVAFKIGSWKGLDISAGAKYSRVDGTGDPYPFLLVSHTF
jgi:hypothetical protein